MRHGPHVDLARRASTGPALEPEPVVLAHRLDAAAEVDPLRPDRRVEQLGERRRQRAPLVERAQDVLARGRVDPLEQRQHLVRGSGRARVAGFDESTRQASPRSRQYASVSSRQTQSSGRTTPSSRRTLIPFVFPLETSR